MPRLRKLELGVVQEQGWVWARVRVGTMARVVPADLNKEETLNQELELDRVKTQEQAAHPKQRRSTSWSPGPTSQRASPPVVSKGILPSIRAGTSLSIRRLELRMFGE